MLERYFKDPSKKPVGLCQICGSMTDAKEGMIAYHGHKKVKGTDGEPGYITDACWGSRKQPLEVTKQDLLKYISDMREYVRRLARTIREYEDDMSPDGQFQNKPSNHVIAFEKIKAECKRDMLNSTLDDLIAKSEKWKRLVTEKQWASLREEMMVNREAATRKGWKKRERKPVGLVMVKEDKLVQVETFEEAMVSVMGAKDIVQKIERLEEENAMLRAKLAQFLSLAKEI